MNLLAVLLIGAIVGAIEGGSVFFARDEPYKMEITLAATLKGLLVGLLTALSLHPHSPWWQAAGMGSLYGLGFALVVFLANGGFKGHDAPYVVPSGVVAGPLIGVLISVLAF
jgi:hypothetical protein